MAGGVAHDFNNLLCGVVGNAEVALRKVPPEAPPLLSRCLTEILNFAGEAAQLSKQMLAHAGKRSLGIAALQINAELTIALRLLHATVSAKARLVLELADELPEVAADRFQLRQVVTNLVLNAVVLDLTIPEKSGEQILDELRLVRGDVPVVITSGFQAQDASRLLHVPNVIGFLDKPHTLGNLKSVLAALGTRLTSAGAA